MNYIHFFSVEIPEWMAQSNQVAQTVGFNRDVEPITEETELWSWLNELAEKYSKEQEDEQTRVN